MELWLPLLPTATSWPSTSAVQWSGSSISSIRSSLTLGLSRRRQPTIRPLKRADLPKVIALHHAVLTCQLQSSFYLNALIQANQLCLVASTPSASIVGCIVARIDADAIYISSLFVAPAYQSQGIATLLHDALPKRRRVSLHCAKSNTAGRRFYDRRGFRAVRTIPGFYRGVLKESEAVEYVREDL